MAYIRSRPISLLVPLNLLSPTAKLPNNNNSRATDSNQAMASSSPIYTLPRNTLSLAKSKSIQWDPHR